MPVFVPLAAAAALVAREALAQSEDRPSPETVATVGNGSTASPMQAAAAALLEIAEPLDLAEPAEAAMVAST